MIRKPITHTNITTTSITTEGGHSFIMYQIMKKVYMLEFIPFSHKTGNRNARVNLYRRCGRR